MSGNQTPFPVAPSYTPAEVRHLLDQEQTPDR